MTNIELNKLKIVADGFLKHHSGFFIISSPREYMGVSSITGVRKYWVEDSVVRLGVRTTQQKNKKPTAAESQVCTIKFYGPETVNLFFSPNSDRNEFVDSLSLDLDRSKVNSGETPEIAVNEQDNELWISQKEDPDSVVVVVNIECGEIRFQKNGHTLTSTKAATDVRGQYLTKPMGYSEKKVENWPLQVSKSHLSLRLHPDESIYGFGESFGSLDKKGKKINVSVKQALGVNSSASYKSIPFYLSTRGYGMLAESSTSMSFDVGATAASAIEIESDSDALSLTFFFENSPKHIIKKYTELSGRGELLPKWVYGVWMSKNSYEDSTELRSVASRLNEEGIHCDVIHIDPAWMDLDNGFELQWDNDNFPAPESLLNELSNQGYHVSLWEYPYLHKGTKMFEEAKNEEYLVRSGEDRPYILRRLSANSRPYTPVGIVDFTNTEAVDWWAEHHQSLIEMGVDAFKLDFGEYFPTDGVASDGRTGKTLHNMYPTHYSQAVSKGFDMADEVPVLWNRAGWIGSQRYPVHWGGDPDSTFDGLAASLRGGLSIGVSGFQYWSCDIGGYDGTPSTEVYIRWLQWAVLATSSPRFHGNTPREPWEYGDLALDIARRYIGERYKLLPYIYSLAAKASKEGIPLLRPMFIEFPDADIDLHQESQCMMGPALLIAPVLHSDEEVTVSLPEGIWIEYWTGNSVKGGQKIKLAPDLSEMPIFLRSGQLVLKRDCIKETSQPPETMRLLMAPSAGELTKDSTKYQPAKRSEKIKIGLSLVNQGETVELTTSAPLPVEDLRITIPGAETAPKSVLINDNDMEFDIKKCSTSPPGIEVHPSDIPESACK